MQIENCFSHSLFLSYSSSVGGEYPSSSAPIHTTPLRPTPTQAGPAGSEAPPVLKMETPRTEGAPSPSGHKKRPRPEPLFIPSTVNNKVGEKRTESAVKVPPATYPVKIRQTDIDG